MASLQQLRETICGSCGDSMNRCLRFIGMPVGGEKSWMCRECWHPKGESENRFYDHLYGIPPWPAVTCCLCSRPAPTKAIWISYLLREEAMDEPGQDRKPAAIESRQTKRDDIPKRRAYPLDEAAVLLGISLSTLKQEILDGKISFVYVRQRRHILDAELNRYPRSLGNALFRRIVQSYSCCGRLCRSSSGAVYSTSRSRRPMQFRGVSLLNC